MSDHFNGLTPAEAERLALLLEELGEAQQVIGKILRHGYESVNPDLPPPAGDTNRANLERELGDVLVAIGFLLDAGDIDEHLIEDRKRVKRHKVWQWLHHQAR
jgi:NTP pyrophosphatase (non-canonical NTP hydrolase)